MILFIIACVRKESRTKKLADYLLEKWNDQYEEVRLSEVEFPLVDEEFLCRRDKLAEKRDFGDIIFDFARQFAKADKIVIAAPFWDLSFPAALKQYLEQVNVVGITFSYTSEGVPVGLCKAKSLTYITTAGGDYFPEEYGAGYVRALAQNFYGIPEFNLIKATGLDIDGADIESIIAKIKIPPDTITVIYLMLSEPFCSFGGLFFVFGQYRVWNKGPVFYIPL